MKYNTVDGSEIRHPPVEVGSLFPFFVGFYTSQVVQLAEVGAWDCSTNHGLWMLEIETLEQFPAIKKNWKASEIEIVWNIILNQTFMTLGFKMFVFLGVFWKVIVLLWMIPLPTCSVGNRGVASCQFHGGYMTNQTKMGQWTWLSDWRELT